MSLRIILADDHPIFRLGLRAVLSGLQDVIIVREACAPQELLDALSSEGCDLLLTDFMMPSDSQNDGLRLIERIRRLYPDLPVIVITMLQNPALFSSILELGIKGLLSKSSLTHELPTAIKAVISGKPYIAQSVKNILDIASGIGNDQLMHMTELSPREVEVIRLLVSGLTSRQISLKLNRSKQTISAQKKSAMRKLGLTTDMDLFAYADQHGLVS